MKTIDQLANDYATEKVPLMQDYHQWKAVKQIFIDGYEACKNQTEESTKQLIELWDPKK